MRRRYKLKERYGLSLEDYEDLLEEQEGLCAICREVCASRNKLVVDHCHASNTVRGLLCSRCNIGIGQLQEDPRRLHSAAVYLINHQDTGDK